MNYFAKARALALITPVLLMAGALGSQYYGGLIPCEMCQWQRWPHYSAIGFALIAFVMPKHWLVILAMLSILVSGAIGIWHAGIEYHWWQGLTHCASLTHGVSIADIMKMPLVRCDEAQWRMFGVSLAGYNGLISIGAAIGIGFLLKRSRL